jgi:hypothetical protein
MFDLDTGYCFFTTKHTEKYSLYFKSKIVLPQGTQGALRIKEVKLDTY